jgi:hypothetical protein
MKRPSLLRTVCLLLALGVALPLSAAPRFADKETALTLAQALDKGLYRGKLISSTFVQSMGKDQYLIKVVLENGGEENWDLNQIRQYSKDDLLTLSRNRALVFPLESSSEFGVLDKNQFAQTALRARVYIKSYRSPDVLAGERLAFATQNFNLADLLNVTPSRDDRGYVYRYILDLENGQRERLSYLEAWEVLKRNGLLEEPAGNEPVLHTPYRLTALRPRPLERLVESGIGRFGVEMVFDRPIELQPAVFPFRIYEDAPANGTPRLDRRFTIEFTAPNAVLSQPVAGIDHLEFLYGIHAGTDTRHQNRVLVMADFAPEVLTQPPVVTVADNTVTVTFTKVEDQSVFDREALRQAELRREQEKRLAGTLTPEEVERRKLYRQHMETGLGQLDKVRAVKDFNERIDQLQAALANFKEAAINASSDPELEEALRQRNALMVRLPAMIIPYVRQALAQKPVADPQRLKELLLAARSMSREPSVRQALTELSRQLEAP